MNTLPTIRPLERRNRLGYEHAVTFRSKLTHVSPVWYQLKRKAAASSRSGPRNGFHLEGSHEVNQTWMKELRTPAREAGGVVVGCVCGGGVHDAEAAHPGQRKVVVVGGRYDAQGE